MKKTGRASPQTGKNFPKDYNSNR